MQKTVLQELIDKSISARLKELESCGEHGMALMITLVNIGNEMREAIPKERQQSERDFTAGFMMGQRSASGFKGEEQTFEHYYTKTYSNE